MLGDTSQIPITHPLQFKKKKVSNEYKESTKTGVHLHFKGRLIIKIIIESVPNL